MKLSEIADLNALTIDDYTKIVYGDYVSNIKDADAIILLGGDKMWCLDRADACAKLDRIVNIKYIIPTGGVEAIPGFTEAMYLRKLLIERGVDKDKIILENKATTTKENMIYANEILKMLSGVKKLVIVTSHFHLRRGMELAKSYFDNKYQIEGYPGLIQEGNKENWYKSTYYTERVKQEVYFLKSHIERGYIKEIEY